MLLNKSPDRINSDRGFYFRLTKYLQKYHVYLPPLALNYRSSFLYRP
jgi:hypothetical protein